VLAFLGDLANPFTGDNAAQLRDAAPAFEHVGAGLAAIAPAGCAALAAFDARYNVPYLLLADAAQTARAAFGVATSAVFVIDTSGVVRFARIGANAADHPPTSLIVEACSQITGIEPPAPPPSSAPAFTMSDSLPFSGSAAKNAAFGSPPCGKCGNSSYERYDVSTAGGWISRIFNFQRRKFLAVSCMGCGYTELYRRQAHAAANIMDLLATG
jgi:predicted nucleic-acid-binding Zn-ribbon protein